MASPEPDLGDHPGPPADLAKRRLHLTHLDSPAFRIFPIAHEPLYFGKRGLGRWDDPKRRYGVLYAATTPAGAFAERLLVRPGMLAQGIWIPAQNVPVSTGDLQQFGLAEVQIASPLRCVDLRGPGLAAIEADARLTSGPHRASQQWSRPLFEHPQRPDGIVWRSRADPEQTAVALHERVRATLSATVRGRLADPRHADLLETISARYNLVILAGAF
jgi:RES domain